MTIVIDGPAHPGQTPRPSQSSLILDYLGHTTRTALILAASFYLIIYLVIAFTRIQFPFELEWMEGASVVQVQRILDHKPVYTAPSVRFTPLVYAPFYFYMSALFARFVGNDFFSLRLVSLLSSLGCFALIFAFVHRRTDSWFSSSVATGLFAATFRIAGAWFDVARVDSLFLLLLLGGIYTSESRKYSIRTFLSPFLLFLAFFTKQVALVVIICIYAARCVTEKGKQRYLPPIIFGLLGSGSVLIYNYVSQGWYYYWVFGLTAQHEVERGSITSFWTADLLSHLPVAVCLCALAVLKKQQARHPSSQRAILSDASIFGGLLVSSYLSRIHSGGYDNVLMPAFAGIAIYCGIGLDSLFKGPPKRALLVSAALLAMLFQFYHLRYPSSAQIPTDQDALAGKQLQDVISSFRGEVYLSDHPWYLQRVHKEPQAQDMAILDVLRASRSESLRSALRQEMARAVDDEKYDAFIVDFEEFSLRPADFDQHYTLRSSGLTGNAFHPVTGWDRKPSYLFVRK